jgi:predicted dehydrogenase
MTKVRFGIIGCGLMGREFASAAARWCHLPGMTSRPEIVAICDTNPALFTWYADHFPSITQTTTDYRELLDNKSVDAVYCAVPHLMHGEIFCAILDAGKHLMGEKPFGIDLPANDAIMKSVAAHPELLVRCSSEFPFIPAVQRIGQMIEQNVFGQIIEVNAAFLHSSDLDPQKPINWKRMVQYNGEYGCMGDLGMHVCHLPFRAGWVPNSVRAILTNIVRERPDGKGAMVPCETWDNATLLCDVTQQETNSVFPMSMKTWRIAPGEKDTWFIEILGAKASARFSTKNPKRLEFMSYSSGGEQSWSILDMGHETAFPSITGGIFEFGFSDSILQMWAAFLFELEHGRPFRRFAGCATPDETAISHQLFSAALKSHRENKTVSLSRFFESP